MPNQPKLLLVFFLTIISPVVNSQTTWVENFSDSNFTANPAWAGATANFMVNSQKQLQLNAAPATASSSLATASKTAIKGTWEFFVALGFNPSSSNFAQVFVLSSSPNTSNTNGYFVQVGGTTDDKISLYKKTGSTNTLLAESQIGLINAANVHVRIKVARDSLHNWTLLADTAGGSNFLVLGTAVDSTFTNSNFFVLNCVYTSTRADKFFVDDILVNGAQIIDAQKPKIVSETFPELNSIRLHFSEPIDSATGVKTNNFILLETNKNPQNIVWDKSKPNQLLLIFNAPLPIGYNYTLRCEAVEDLFGNELQDTLVEFLFFIPRYRSLTINEIMADPSPPVNLPDAEYAELNNDSGTDLDLSGWLWVAGTDTFELPNYIFRKNTHVLIVAESEAHLFSNYPIITVSAPAGYLNNTQEYLAVLTEKGVAIDALTYSSDWHDNSAKKEGGWSLTQAGPSLWCFDAENWTSNYDPDGGTPGATNWVDNLDSLNRAELTEVLWVNANEVVLTFAQGISIYRKPKITASRPANMVAFNPSRPTEVRMVFIDAIGSQPVSIYVQKVPSCSGYFSADTLTFSAPQTAEIGDVVLNEILFNPAGEVEDFVEIWNTSAKTMLLGSLRLANVDASGNVTNQFTLGAENALLLPGEFLVVGLERTELCAKYSCAKRRFYSETATPSMPDAEGNIALTNAALLVLEQVNYSEDWHHQLISSADGVSLERIHPALKSNEASSWHSAASAVNYASPGRVNSQFSGNAVGQGSISVQSSTVSPNNDGQNDVLLLTYNLPQSAVLSVVIFGVNGVQMATIADQLLTENSGTLSWDGTDENGQLAASGIYIVLAEWFTPSGEKGMQKLNIVVSR